MVSISRSRRYPVFNSPNNDEAHAPELATRQKSIEMTRCSVLFHLVVLLPQKSEEDMKR